MVRKNAQVEVKAVGEYLVAHYGKFRHKMAVPLGKVDEKLMATEGYQKAINISRPYRPEVDAVVWLPNYLVLIEYKVWNIVNGLAKLPLYKSLVPFTPELKEDWGKEVLMELVVGWTYDNLDIMARDAGVKVVVFCPDWLLPVVQKQHLYWTKEYQLERQRKLATREIFGVE